MIGAARGLWDRCRNGLRRSPAGTCWAGPGHGPAAQAKLGPGVLKARGPRPDMVSVFMAIGEKAVKVHERGSFSLGSDGLKGSRRGLRCRIV